MASELLPDRAISVRAPWWWAILHLRKDIENRPKPWAYRGRVWLHASAWWSLAGVEEDWAYVRTAYRAAGGQPGEAGLTWREMRDAGGAIVGSVELCGSVTYSESPWFVGPFGIGLANPVALETPVPCKGALGLFRPPADVIAALSARGEAHG